MPPSGPPLMRLTTSIGSRQNTLVIPSHIRANPRIALVVYDSTVPPGTGTGVNTPARVSELADSRECREALAYLQSRGWKHPPSVDMVVGATLRGVYKAVPEKIWINTEDEHGLDGRVEIDMLEI